MAEMHNGHHDVQYGGHHPEGEGAKAPENPMKVVHRLLRGRYLKAGLLGAVIATPMSIAAYRVIPPKFQATGVIEVANAPDRLMYEIQETAPILKFKTTLETIAARVRARRVIDRAAEVLVETVPEWPTGVEGKIRLQESLTVTTAGAKSPNVYVSVQDESALISMRAANAILDTYREIHIRDSAMLRRKTLLQGLSRSYEKKVRDQREQLGTLAMAYGTVNLGDRQAGVAERLADTKAWIANFNARLAAMDGSTESGDGASEGDDSLDLDSNRIELERLASVDPVLADMLSQRRSLRASMESLSQRFGPEHREIVRLASLISVSDRRILDRAELVHAEVPSPETGVEGTKEEIEARLVALMADRSALEQDLQDMNRVALDVERVRGLLEDSEELLGDANGELAKIEAELGSGADFQRERIEPAPLPLEPSTDRRNIMAAASAFAGFGMSACLFAFIGWKKMGFDRISDFSELGAATPLLGVLPDMGSREAHDEGAAALSVHHLRNLLIVRRSDGKPACRVYAITSPASGDGKTSLAQALALSFASIGHRTILVDADMVAHGLSRQLGLGEEQGLWQALEGVELSKCIHETEHTNLHAMPTGALRVSEPERLGGNQLGVVLTKLREDFDSVLIDTGPLLGSLDASLATSNADEVLLVVGRGQQLRLVHGALSRLRALGAPKTGVVFNRAQWNDLQQSVSPVSLNTHSMRSVPVDMEEFTGRSRSKRTLASRSARSGTQSGGLPKL